MSNKLNVRVIKTGEELTIQDVEPLETAKLFWEVSDEIWQNSANDHKLNCFDIDSVYSATEATELINENLIKIDKKLVISGIGKAITLSGMRPEDNVTLDAEMLNNPSRVRIGTFNWDERNSWRQVEIDDKLQTIEFTDGHKDRYRELYTSVDFIDKKRNFAQLTYSMQRLQYKQDQPTALTLSVWHSQLAETGYEGSHLWHTQLSSEQELKFLNLISKLGGFSVGNH